MDDLGKVRERREALLGAAASVEAALAAPASDPRWSDRLGERLATLHATLEEHVTAAEADDGILAQVRDEAPRLSNQVDRLAAEHGTITGATERLIDRLEGTPTDQVTGEAESVREQAVQLLAAIVRHRQLGADLLYEAYNVDVGGPG
jgi:hypothetical protein